MCLSFDTSPYLSFLLNREPNSSCLNKVFLPLYQQGFAITVARLCHRLGTIVQ